MKEKIHILVNEKHRESIPEMQDIRNYLKLHWSIVAVKQKQLQTALQMAFPAAFSPTAWKLLIAAAKSRKRQRENDNLPKQELISCNL